MLVLSGACAPQTAAERAGDAAFFDVGAAEAVSSDGGAPLGVVCALDGSCAAGVTCCPTEAPRCVPAASGTNACVAAGDAALGAACGLGGVDDCGVGAVCVGGSADGATCRRTCVDASTCEGSECLALPVPGGQVLGVCSNDPE